MPSSLSPQEFVAKWRSSNLRENAAYVEHFLDLCHLVNHPTPASVDNAVFDAYGWPHDLSDEELLARLLALNLERAAGQGNVVPATGTVNDEVDE